MPRRSPFVSKAEVPVYEFEGTTLDPETGQIAQPDIIYIREALGSKADNELKNTLFRANSDNMKLMEVRVVQDYELLCAFVTRWNGPSYRGIPVTRENIAELDLSHPHIEKVLAKIAELNIKKKPDDAEAAENTDPKSPAMSGMLPNGARNSEGSEPLTWETSMTSSSLPNLTLVGVSENS